MMFAIMCGMLGYDRCTVSVICWAMTDVVLVWYIGLGYDRRSVSVICWAMIDVVLVWYVGL